MSDATTYPGAPGAGPARGVRVGSAGRLVPVRRRLVAGLGALAAALVLAVVPLPPGGDARASAAEQGSAVTKTGTKGPYDDFSQVKVTVGQTADLRGQAVKVSWTGATPGTTEKARDFMQIMQCWGDDPEAGPSREQCEFGAGGTATPGGTRALVPGSDMDPGEDGYGDVPTEPGVTDQKYVPFRPADGPATTSAYDYTYFTGGDSNSLPWVQNDSDGSGEAIFEVTTALEAPHLACGARRTADGKVQPCWLVVVPRGDHNPDGRLAESGTSPQAASGLSRSVWDQRIVFRLDFLPVGDNCDADKPERRTIGSELVTDAMTSWQGALCTAGTRRFTFTQTGEDTARFAVTSPTDTSPGLAFTVDPVESGAAGAAVVHAPVAISGLTIGFLWNYDEPETDASRHVGRLRLNQRLLAKLLTESYVENVRMTMFNQPPPETVAGNPLRISTDPEFLELNPDIKAGRNAPNGMIVGLENSDTARMLWRYLIENDAARAFLEGEPDPWGMRMNSSYTSLELADEPINYYPKSDTTATGTLCPDVSYTSQNLVPYANDLHAAALKIRRGYSGLAFLCDRTTVPVGLQSTRPPLVGAHEIGIADSASARRYLLDVAALPNADGTFVKPTDATLLKAVAQMPDSSVEGVKAADPSKARGSAYPLTSVVYAAASVDQARDARDDYAKVIRYAAGPGQRPGTAAGELPAGYAPLPQAMRDQALAAATALEKGVAAGGDDPADGAPPAGGAQGAAGGGFPAGAADGGGGDVGGAASGAGGGAGDTADADAPSAAPPGGAGGAGQPVAESAVGGTTPGQLLGAVRWVLLGVLLLAAAASLAGPVLLRLAARRGGTGAVAG
ncbi:hypothetical protein [uncultured Streptomyces sp.]|uniref:hypothetical protein n=1 Tax=uncultured Streptomyces sp. TaxID=174707 RepID=UPI00260D7CA0|nr:hypothetical protein [uncultured Streptomyces sp.]